MQIRTGDRGQGRARVVESHRLLAAMLLAAGVFGVVGVAWAIGVAIRGGSWWGPIHALMAGAALSAISGATQMFTITWSSARAPRRPLIITQGVVLWVGVALVLVGIPTNRDWIVWSGGTAVVVALILLGAALLGTIRRSLLRRFDLSIRFYFVALSAGVIGVTLGVLLGTGSVASRYGDFRQVHLHLNLVGLIGLTVVGTLPTLLPTFVKHRAVSRREARIAWWLGVGGVVAIAAGLFAPLWTIGAGTLLVAAAATTIVVGIVGRLGRKGLRGGLPFFHVLAGVCWLVAWACVDAFGLLTEQPLGHFSGWTAAAVVVGVVQVIVGSVAYLVPVLVGPPIGANLDRMTGNPWLPVILANAAGVALVAGWTPVATVFLALWIIDLGRRLASLRKPPPR
ncbi:MAG: hypothetical protein R2823_03165 [Acidimicrobiia bacterium]